MLSVGVTVDSRKPLLRVEPVLSRAFAVSSNNLLHLHVLEPTADDSSAATPFVLAA